MATRAPAGLANTLRMAGVITGVMLLISLSITRVEATLKDPGLGSDCMMDFLGSRGICTIICAGEYAMKNIASILPVIQCVNSTLTGKYVKNIKTVFAEGSAPSYDEIYTKLIADREGICEIEKEGLKCAGDLTEKACGELGKKVQAGMKDFVESHLDCENLKSTTMFTCITSPKLINEIIRDFETPDSFDHKCMAEIMKQPFVTNLHPVIATMTQKFKEPNKDELGGIRVLMDYLRDNTRLDQLCNLITNAVSCVKSELRRVAKNHCNEYDLDVFQDQVDAGTDVLFGCANRGYYDLMTCGLDLDFWLGVLGFGGAPPTCPLDMAKIGASFGKMAADLMNGWTSGGSIDIMNDGFCDIVDFVECLAGKIRIKCKENFLYDTLMSIFKPIREWVDLKQECPGRSRISVMTTCKCHSKNFPVGNALSGSCTLSKRDKYQCGGYVLKKGEKGGSGGMRPGILTVAISVLLTIARQV